jgi:hypothetical protein
MQECQQKDGGMVIDLKAAIRKWAIDTLPYDQSDPDVVAEINGKDAP